MQLIIYLTFNGNCREAMTFYQDCLGGELHVQTVGETPMADSLPQQMKDCVLHSSLRRDDMVFMATDMVGDQGLVRGNAVSILIECSSEAELREYYDKLSAGGRSIYPVERTHWGALFGGLMDRYGNHWLLNYSNDW